MGRILMGEKRRGENSESPTLDPQAPASAPGRGTGNLPLFVLSPEEYLTPYRVTCRCGEAAAGIRPRTARGAGAGVVEGMGAGSRRRAGCPG